MKGQSVLHSSASDDWLTPPELFERLDRKWRFTLDPCACDGHVLDDAMKSCTRADDGLSLDWSGWSVYCNPPYSNIAAWVEKAASHRDNALIVMLIPARTDTRYWHKHIEGKALKVEFLPGRLKFGRPDGSKSQSAPFPSCLVYF